MKFRFFICFLIITTRCFSQETFVTGIVFDKDNKDRVAAVNVRNISTGISVYNNLKGEFKISAKEGDKLVFSKQDYHPDTIKIEDISSLAVYIARVAIQLREVTIRDTVLTPEKRLEATKQDYTKIYGSLAYRDFLSTPSSGGAGLSIDALYNSLSRSGRNAEHLKEIIENDYRQNVIDYRFNRTFVGKITGLKDEKLTAFMQRYRPGYYTIETATEYEFIAMIRANLKRFLRNSRTASLQPLQSK
jgi:hypothetical protein